ncbi:hypothetical protein Nepgr_028023 [Nepenthes gracilis]|uniref:Remorin C-terminal domain-containing protein n=1 Tax=Nepenthes gracilis TaxID=150966 RepID=A0AAD3T9J3_NEPGR|nr:hypothetical protein Nepgr_028023 [Nepenthes gracilis]
MVDFIKQVSIRFVGMGQKPTSIREGKAPPQETRSFNGDRKPLRWFGRQFSGQMNDENDSNGGGEYAAAVAAAAFAISSLESDVSYQRKPTAGLETSMDKIKINGKAETTPMLADYSGTSKRFTDSSMAETNGASKKPIRLMPSLRRTSTFPDKQFEDMKTTKEEGIEEIPTFPSPPIFPPAAPPLIKPGFPPNRTQMPQIEETEADVWENAQMAKIQQRYQKLDSKIGEWEDSKKKKAKDSLERTESELQQSRDKALRQYKIEMERINQIAAGARAQAEDKQRNDVLKLKEKANEFRRTGELPRRCACF